MGRAMNCRRRVARLPILAFWIPKAHLHAIRDLVVRVVQHQEKLDRDIPVFSIFWCRSDRSPRRTKGFHRSSLRGRLPHSASVLGPPRFGLSPRSCAAACGVVLGQFAKVVGQASSRSLWKSSQFTHHRRAPTVINSCLAIIRLRGTQVYNSPTIARHHHKSPCYTPIGCGTGCRLSSSGNCAVRNSNRTRCHSIMRSMPAASVIFGVQPKSRSAAWLSSQ